MSGDQWRIEIKRLKKREGKKGLGLGDGKIRTVHSH